MTMSHHTVISDAGLLVRYSFLILLLTALPLCAVAAPIYAVQGEEIPLGGTATGSDVVYLFLTGPNLPPEGISLVGGTPVTTGVPGSFTRVDVNTGGTWAYTWRTGSLGRVLSEGNYLIYTVEEPRARSDLDDTVYATQPVIFGAPVETVTIARLETAASVPSGTMQGGPLVTGLQTPGGSTLPPGIPPPATPARPHLPVIIPLGAAALALAGPHRRR
jgi:hypothetical protein